MRDESGEAVRRPLDDRLEKEPHQVVEPAGVVVVAVGEDDPVEVEEVDLQPPCIPDNGVGVARIEKYPPAFGLDVRGEPVSAAK